MNGNGPIGLGLIGCGAFGMFCLDAYQKLDGVRIAAVADVRPEAAEQFAQRYDVPGFSDPDELIHHPDVGLVHIATPPASHHELAMKALAADKHVLCEKPLAMNLGQASEMLAEAENRHKILPVNFVMRYNAVAQKTQELISSGLLGTPLAARLTNCAQDTVLFQGHWFWDKNVSGGIFVEHGVHFFDLYDWWFGSGRVIYSHAERHGELNRESRVTCTIRYDSGLLASQYHGFDQVHVMDRTDHRIVCELGDIEVDGWVPLTLRVLAAVNKQTEEKLLAMLPGAKVDAVADVPEPMRNTAGRGKPYKLSHRIRLRWTPNEDKGEVYAQNIRDLLADQLAYLADGNHRRRVVELNGRNALALAEDAAKRASSGDS